MALIPTSLLATGGIAAAAVALWSQIRHTAQYVSSFVVVTARIGNDLTAAVRYHLYANHRLVPSGLLHYTGYSFLLRDRPRPLLVPFRLPGERALYVGRRTVIFRHGGQGALTLRALRGTMDFDAFVCEALDAYAAHLATQDVGVDNSMAHPASRFGVYPVMGREKGEGAAQWASAGRGPPVGDPHDAPSQRPASPDEIGMTAAEISYLRSFKYPREVYTPAQGDAPLAALYFSPEIHAHIEHARQWYGLRDWYMERSIPWRRGWLLQGPPGTGKSSLARAVAQTLGIPIYHYHLATLSDQEFTHEWSGMSTPCVVLWEDFESVFHFREPRTEHRLLTFDCLLNALSGVDSINGVFLVITTNHPEMIDPALGVAGGGDAASSRPGRIDTVIEVGLMATDNRRRMAAHILRDWPEEIEALVERTDGHTPVQVQEACLQVAYARLQAAPPAAVA